jgi:hypothetical protein
VTNNGGTADLLHNATARPGHWLKFKLHGKHCNRDAIGAKMTLTAGGRSLTQEVRAGSSYLSQSDLRLHFGLGEHARPDSIRVSWPCGRTQEVAPPERPDRIVDLTEG